MNIIYTNKAIILTDGINTTYYVYNFASNFFLKPDFWNFGKKNGGKVKHLI